MNKIQLTGHYLTTPALPGWSAFISIKWRQHFLSSFFFNLKFYKWSCLLAVYLFPVYVYPDVLKLGSQKIEILSRLHCIDIYDDAFCLGCWIPWTCRGIESRSGQNRYLILMFTWICLSVCLYPINV